MAKVCKNIRIVNNYLDQIDERNSVEKDRFSKVFKDYSKLLIQIKELTDQLKVKERENYNSQMFSSDQMMTKSSIHSSDMIGAEQKSIYENQIKELEKKLMKIQEGKIDNTESILELTKENKQLTRETQELQKRERALKERLSEVEHQMSELLVDESEKDNMTNLLKDELKQKKSEIQDLEDKNRNLTQECQVLTVRMLEEKSKIVEMMNEANNLFEVGSRAKSMTMADPHFDNDFKNR